MSQFARVYLAYLSAALLMLAGVCDVLVFRAYGQAPVHPAVGLFAVLAGMGLAIAALVAMADPA